MPSFVSCDTESVYSVVAVRYGSLVAERSDMFLNYTDYGQADGRAALDYYFWVIANDVRTVVLDTGFDAHVGARRGRTVHIDPRVALDALGVRDELATTVILSHAHYDHIGNASHFRRAQLLMAAAEYDFWVAHPRGLHLTDQLTEPTELGVLREARATGRVRLIDGDTEVAPGIRVIEGYGHTPGQLMLVVDTWDGAILLTSDAVHLDEEWERRMPFRHMCDLAAAVDTYALIDALLSRGVVNRVFTGHQPGMIGRFPADPRLADHSLVLATSTPR